VAENTKIEWAANADGSPGATWNPIHGCSRISEGCRNCYAERMAARFCGEAPYGKPGPFSGFASMTPSGPRWTGRVELVPDALTIPLKKKKPTVYFANSMSDLFHEALPSQSIAEVFGVMAVAGAHEPGEDGRFGKKYTQERGWYGGLGPHTFIVLTKRAKRLRELLSSSSFQREVSHSAYRWAHDRVNAGYLSDCIWQSRDAAWCAPGRHGRLWPLPNVILGVSCEDRKNLDRLDYLRAAPAACRVVSFEPLLEDPGMVNLDGIGWAIVGGESGPGARPMQVEWARSLRDQCAAAGVPFFFKQWGGVRKKLAGRELDGRTWDERPLLIDKGVAHGQ
jgi:protein gp37